MLQTFILLTLWCVNNANANHTESIKAGSTPNIIFFLLDDFGYGDLSATGAEYSTPNLDDLFDNGIELRSHYIGLLCSPSRTQMLTGRYAWNLGLSSFYAFGHSTIESIPAAVPTIGTLLKEYTAYSTYAVTKWQLGYAAWEHTPLYRGFDHFYGFYNGQIDYWNKTLIGYIDWREDNEVDYVTQYTFSTWTSRDRLLNIVEQHSAGGMNENVPFFAYTALQAPHDTLVYIDSENAANCDDITEYSRYIYCLNIMAVDHLVGQVMNGLKENELWDDTLIVFTSDNGAVMGLGGCNYPYRGDKHALFDGGIRTVAFVGGGYIPSDQKGWKRTSMMHGSDWTPTLLSLAGVDVSQVNINLKSKVYQPILQRVGHPNANRLDSIPDAFDGLDLSHWLIYGDETENPRTNVPLSVNNWNVSANATDHEDDPISIVFLSNVTNHRYKIIYSLLRQGNYCDYCEDDTTGDRERCAVFSTPNGTRFLYDLTLDYNETTNLYNSAGDVNDPKRIAKLKRLLGKNNKTREYEIKKHQRLMKRGVNVAISGGNDTNTNGVEIEDLWDYFVYMDSNLLVSQLWEQGKQLAMSYTTGPFYNTYSQCQRKVFMNAASPAKFGGAYTPWCTFDEYVTKMNNNCGDDYNEALMELYTTLYDQY